MCFGKRFQAMHEIYRKRLFLPEMGTIADAVGNCARTLEIATRGTRQMTLFSGGWHVGSWVMTIRRMRI